MLPQKGWNFRCFEGAFCGFQHVAQTSQQLKLMLSQSYSMLGPGPFISDKMIKYMTSTEKTETAKLSIIHNKGHRVYVWQALPGSLKFQKFLGKHAPRLS